MHSHGHPERILRNHDTFGRETMPLQVWTWPPTNQGLLVANGMKEDPAPWMGGDDRPLDSKVRPGMTVKANNQMLQGQRSIAFISWYKYSWLNSCPN